MDQDVKQALRPLVRSSVERGDKFADRWPGIWCGRERQVAKGAVAADYGVGAELADVLGGPLEPSTGADESEIHPDRARRPDLAVRATLCTEQFVDDSVGVSDDIEREPKVRPVGGEAFGGGEGDDGDPGVTELVEVIAHGDHVFLAGQSSQVPVQDQHEWSATHLGGAPRPTFVIDELDIGEQVIHLERHVGVPVPALRRYHGRLESGGPLDSTASARTRRALGLTMLTPPMVTVGTVSLPLATDRTNSAASRFSQMLTSRNVRPARRRPARSAKQYGHPGRV